MCFFHYIISAQNCQYDILYEIKTIFLCMISYHLYRFRIKQKISDLTESQYCDIIDLYNNHREE